MLDTELPSTDMDFTIKAYVCALDFTVTEETYKKRIVTYIQFWNKNGSHKKHGPFFSKMCEHIFMFYYHCWFNIGSIIIYTITKQPNHVRTAICPYLNNLRQGVFGIYDRLDETKSL